MNATKLKMHSDTITPCGECGREFSPFELPPSAPIASIKGEVYED